MNLKNILIFLAGAEFFHTIVHVLIHYTVKLPLVTSVYTLTPQVNNLGIGINAFVTLALLYLAMQQKETN